MLCLCKKLSMQLIHKIYLTYWGRVAHICVIELKAIIGLHNDLSHNWRQAITWTNAGMLLIGPWGTNFNDIFYNIQPFSFRKICLKISSWNWQPFCLILNVLRSILKLSQCQIKPNHNKTQQGTLSARLTKCIIRCKMVIQVNEVLE